MQTKPNASTVIYLAMNGHQLEAPGSTMNDSTYVGLANITDINGQYIGNNESRHIKGVRFPSSKLSSDQQDYLAKMVATKFEIFDVNITTELSVFTDYDKMNRFMCIVCPRPSYTELNSLINDKNQNITYPYSFRRYLIGAVVTDTELVNQSTETGTISINALNEGGSTPNPSYISACRNQGRDQSVLLPSIVWTTTSESVFMDLDKPIGDRSYEENYFRPYDDCSILEMARTIAHELGHLFTLQHDGDSDKLKEYYEGHNNWCPIMGATYKNETELYQWSKGEYKISTNKYENDLLVINEHLPFIKSPLSTKLKFNHYDKRNIIH
jgi:hypothetical protein